MSTPSVADFCLFLKELLQDQNGKLRKDGKNCDACEINFETDGSQCDDGTLYLCETDEEEAKTASK